jgi:hypothetical protein
MSNKLKEIIDGHINELKSMTVGVNAQAGKIFRQRETICQKCPLKSGNRCDTSKVVTDNLKTLAFDSTLKVVRDKDHLNGFYYVTESGERAYRGCGCRLSAKQKSPDSVCPAGFWGGEFNKNKK